MRGQELVGVTEFHDKEGHKIQLEYYLLSEPRDIEEEIVIYGIEIKKIIKENGTIKKEKEIARAISYSQHYVEQLIQVLLRNQVTPMTMIEIIDEYITKEGLSA
ncbi:MAG: hypothetical protein HFI05_08220 [Lachnospiraceae bacterium]|jgi:hypothetical protein|nr:hypothetical protein [Lachnospiraceae bacterium]